jgi:NADPH:quinone reductase-like Zn-dependent oxidoreductase
MQTTSSDRATDTATMNAIVQTAYGSSDVLRYTNVPRPVPAGGEVLIEVHAAGMDRGTWHVMHGTPYLIRLGFGVSKPRRPIPGLDVAGIVSAVGPGVTRFEVGDAVFGIARGSFAEYAVAKEAKLAHKPANVPFERAAVVPVSGLTALQALHRVGNVEPGDRVLVVGASGGVGSYAVQLAAAAGAEVHGVASAAKSDFVRSLGATEVSDYRTTDVAALDRTYDLIIDINGRNPVSGLRRILAPTGTLVLVGGEDGDRVIGGMHRQVGALIRSLFTQQRLTMFISTEDQESLEQLGRLLGEGTIRPAVGSTRRLEDAAQAMNDLEAGLVEGKTAIRVR